MLHQHISRLRDDIHSYKSSRIGLLRLQSILPCSLCVTLQNHRIVIHARSIRMLLYIDHTALLHSKMVAANYEEKGHWDGVVKWLDKRRNVNKEKIHKNINSGG